MSIQRENGVYYTAANPFANEPFNRWAAAAGLRHRKILEPFAGNNSLIRFLTEMELCRDYQSYDLDPGAADVECRDTLVDFPTGFDVCITNPPWLAKNSATRRKLPFPDTKYADLYQVCLEQCLANCGWVAAVIPESFIRSNAFRDRLQYFISLTGRMFADTESPVGLALFGSKNTTDIEIWRDSDFIGELSVLEQKRPPKPYDRVKVDFNVPYGNVGLRAIDNNSTASIKFCDPMELGDYAIRGSCRSITKLQVHGKILISDWNEWLRLFREETGDVLLTSFKGVRKDGKYRRRLDWDLARGIINAVGRD